MFMRLGFLSLTNAHWMVASISFLFIAIDKCCYLLSIKFELQMDSKHVLKFCSLTENRYVHGYLITYCQPRVTLHA